MHRRHPPVSPKTRDALKSVDSSWSLVAHSKFKSLLCIREFDGKLCNEIWSTQFRISEAPAWYFANDLTESRDTDNIRKILPA